MVELGSFFLHQVQTQCSHVPAPSSPSQAWILGPGRGESVSGRCGSGTGEELEIYQSHSGKYPDVHLLIFKSRLMDFSHFWSQISLCQKIP